MKLLWGANLIGPRRGLLALGVLGSSSVCGCNQLLCAAAYLKALSLFAQGADPMLRTFQRSVAPQIPEFRNFVHKGTLHSVVFGDVLPEASVATVSPLA